MSKTGGGGGGGPLLDNVQKEAAFFQDYFPHVSQHSAGDWLQVPGELRLGYSCSPPVVLASVPLSRQRKGFEKLQLVFSDNIFVQPLFYRLPE